MDDPYFSLLQEVIAKAYAPYSRFPVAAVARGVSGTDYSGVNVENAAYPQGWCAEASALSAERCPIIAQLFRPTFVLNCHLHAVGLHRRRRASTALQRI